MTRVLVVDDARAIASCSALILQGAGFEAKAVFSGEQAVEVARSYHPDLLLTDISMGAMTGIEAAARIKESLPECKVLFVSAQTGILDALTNARKPAFEFDALRKPVHPTELLARVEQLLTMTA